MDNVNSRIIMLIDSIITINGISIKGVSDGIKWVNKLFKWFLILYNISPIQSLSDIMRHLMWLEVVKIYIYIYRVRYIYIRKSPRKLLKKRNKIRLIEIIIFEKE